MIRACTASVTSTNRTSLAKAINARSCSAAAATSAGGRFSGYLRPSSTASPLTPIAAGSATYLACSDGSSGSAIPVVSTSSPPCSIGDLDRVHPPDRPAEAPTAGQHARAAAAHRIEFQDLRRGGQHFPASTSVSWPAPPARRRAPASLL